MVRTSMDGGVEYAIRRKEDGAWLYDGDMDGTDVAWEPDAGNATWCPTKDDAIRVANINRLTDDLGELDGAYGVWERDWIDEEDMDEDYEEPQPRPSK